LANTQSAQTIQKSAHAGQHYGTRRGFTR
jgi:hypothetical protein